MAPTIYSKISEPHTEIHYTNCKMIIRSLMVFKGQKHVILGC